MKQVNGRVLWLQESLVQAASFASTFEMVAQKRDLARKEEDMANVTRAFMYLYGIAQEEGLFKNPDHYFEDEIIH